jgi:hypothetical protein
MVHTKSRVYINGNDGKLHLAARPFKDSDADHVYISAPDMDSVRNLLVNYLIVASPLYLIFTTSNENLS